MAKTTRHRPTEVDHTRDFRESQHSHFEYGSTHGKWDRGPATDFAITNVNVPDRLDTQEVRARAATDSHSPSVRRFHLSDLARPFRWLIGLGLIGAVAWGAVQTVGPLREAISPAGIESQLGRVLGVPVSVRQTELRYSPSPRLVVTDITVQSGFRLPELAVHFNWRDAMRGLQSATWVLGEARVAPTKLSGTEALAVLKSVRKASNLPVTVSVIRFESVEFPDLPLVPGQYEVVIRRGINQHEFNAVSLKRLDAQGQLDIEVTPPPAGGGNAHFALFATKWAAPVGPAIAWNEATARGEFGADLLKVDSFSVGAGFGNLNGAALLANEGRGWKLAGNLRGPDLNIEELVAFVGGAKGGDTQRVQSPMRGTARFDLAVASNGSTVGETLQRATASGPVTVAGATLLGVNLGLAATQGDLGGAGGVTRFTDLDLEVLASSAGLTIRNISGRAGSFRAYGGFTVDRDQALNGSLRTEVSSPRGVAGTQVRLGGKATAPTYQ